VSAEQRLANASSMPRVGRQDRVVAVQIGEDTAGQSTALPNGEINPKGQAVSNTMALMHDPGTASSGRYAIDVDGVESRIFVKSDGSQLGLVVARR
jgi:hypothetical protein